MKEITWYLRMCGICNYVIWRAVEIWREEGRNDGCFSPKGRCAKLEIKCNPIRGKAVLFTHEPYLLRQVVPLHIWSGWGGSVVNSVSNCGVSTLQDLMTVIILLSAWITGINPCLASNIPIRRNGRQTCNVRWAGHVTWHWTVDLHCHVTLLSTVYSLLVYISTVL